MRAWRTASGDSAAVIGDLETDRAAALETGGDADGAAVRIVTDTVSDQVGEGSGQESRISGQNHLLYVRVHVQIDGMDIREPLIVEITDDGPQQSGRLQLRDPEGLHLIFQSGGQIQVFDQTLDLQALVCDPLCQTLLFLRKRRILFQIRGISHNQ